MKSVADDLRAELREETNRLSLDERIALALRALIGAAASP